MPPPTPSRRGRCDLIVRIATLNSRPGRWAEVADRARIGPRPVGSSSSMISIARIFGAPVTEPGEGGASRSSRLPRGGAWPRRRDEVRRRVGLGRGRLDPDRAGHRRGRGRCASGRRSSVLGPVLADARSSSRRCRGRRALDRQRLNIDGGFGAGTAQERSWQRRPVGCVGNAAYFGASRSTPAQKTSSWITGELRLEAPADVRLEDVAGRQVLQHRARARARCCVGRRRHLERADLVRPAAAPEPACERLR